MSTPTLGERITFTHSLRRTLGWGQTYGIEQGHPKSWVAKPVSHLIYGVGTLSGIVVGVRTLANGHLTYGCGDDPGTWRPTEHFTAYLVAYDVRRKPVYVLPEHCTPQLSEAAP